MNAARYRRRMRASRMGRVTVVGLGDAVVLAAFVGYGLMSHAISPVQFPLHAVLTALPFAIAWVVVAPVGGLYRRNALGSIRGALLRTALVWAVASFLAGAIRATPVFDGQAPPIFLLANVVFGLAFLLPWRLAVALWWSRFASEG